jgi:hypothetical protein
MTAPKKKTQMSVYLDPNVMKTLSPMRRGASSRCR